MAWCARYGTYIHRSSRSCSAEQCGATSWVLWDRRRFVSRKWWAVQFILEAVASMAWPWFGPISNNGASNSIHLLYIPIVLTWPVEPLKCRRVVMVVVDEFGFPLTRVNWLGNVVACMYLPVTIFTPMICSRYGIRVCVSLSHPFVLEKAIDWMFAWYETVLYCVRWPSSIRLGSLCRNSTVASCERCLCADNHRAGTSLSVEDFLAQISQIFSRRPYQLSQLQFFKC